MVKIWQPGEIFSLHLTLILGLKKHAHSGFWVFFDPTVQSLIVLVKWRRPHSFKASARLRNDSRTNVRVKIDLFNVIIFRTC